MMFKFIGLGPAGFGEKTKTYKIIMHNATENLLPEDAKMIEKFLKNDEYYKIPTKLFPSIYHSLLDSVSTARERQIVAFEAIESDERPSYIREMLRHKAGVFDESLRYGRSLDRPRNSTRGTTFAFRKTKTKKTKKSVARKSVARKSVARKSVAGTRKSTSKNVTKTSQKSSRKVVSTKRV